jgi:hypothetical protein
MKRLCCLLLGSCCAVGVIAKAGYVDFKRYWAFPDKLGGVPFEKVEKYDRESFGYSVFYRDGDQLGATVTIYDMGHADIPDGCKGEGVETVLESVDRALTLRVKKGEIGNLKKRGRTVVPKNGRLQYASVMYQYADASITNGINLKLHAAYVTGWTGKYLKLEFAFGVEQRDRARSMADAMIGQLTQLVQKELDEDELAMAACSAFLLDPNGYGGRTAAGKIQGVVQSMGDLNIYTHLFAWPEDHGKPRNADLLVMAYFAGMLEVVLPAGLENGGECEGFIAMLETYRKLRGQQQIEEIPDLEKWLAVEDKRVLFDELLVDE